MPGHGPRVVMLTDDSNLDDLLAEMRELAAEAIEHPASERIKKEYAEIVRPVHVLKLLDRLDDAERRLAAPATNDTGRAPVINLGGVTYHDFVVLDGELLCSSRCEIPAGRVSLAAHNGFVLGYLDDVEMDIELCEACYGSVIVALMARVTGRTA